MGYSFIWPYLFNWHLRVGIWCLKYQKLSKTLIRSRFHGMYWCAHKTATLTSIQHTVIGGSLRVQNWMQKILKSHRPISADSWPASSPYQIVQWFPTIIFLCR